jgi:hypothetical protein
MQLNNCIHYVKKIEASLPVQPAASVSRHPLQALPFFFVILSKAKYLKQNGSGLSASVGAMPGCIIQCGTGGVIHYTRLYIYHILIFEAQ